MAVATLAAGPRTAQLTKPHLNKLADYKRAVYRHPVNWMKAALGLQLWKKQAEIAYALRDHDRVVVRSANAVGKTWIGAALVLWYLNHTAPGYVIITSSSEKNIEKAFFPTIHRIRRSAPCREIVTPVRDLQLSLEYGPQWGAFAVSTLAPERFSGYHTENGCFVIVDEASDLDQDIMDAIDGLCSTQGSKILMIGNPLRPSGPFYEAFQNPDVWHPIHISALHTPNYRTGKNIVPGLATRDWVKDRIAEKLENSPFCQARVFGNFPEETEGVLITIAQVEAAVKRRASDKGPIRMGVDIADQGDDLTDLQIVDGDVAWPPQVYPKTEPMEVVGLVIKAMRDYGIRPENVKLDSIGIGAGVVNRLHELNYAVVGVSAAESADDHEQYANRRVEMAFVLRDWLMTRGQIPKNEPELKRDLMAPQLDNLNSQGQLRLEQKPKTKRRLGHSPDRFDALALAIYKPLPRGTQDVLWDTEEEFYPDGIVPQLGR